MLVIITVDGLAAVRSYCVQGSEEFGRIHDELM